jgi:phospholipase/lecithinase/hemolysin
MANPWRFSRVVLGCAMLFVSALSPTAAAGSNRAFASLFVFGDSLSDSGNAFVLLGGDTADVPYEPIPSAPYDTRRFTNGKTWVEVLADELQLSRGGLPALVSGFFGNYAVGGAQAEGGSVPDFGDQVDLLLKRRRHHVPSNALYVVQFGGNDIRAALQGGDGVTEIQTAIAGIVRNIDKLYDAGARQFLVANAPNIGRTPVILKLGVGAAAELLSNEYNDALDTALDRVAKLPDIEIYRIDLFRFLEAAAGIPQGLGFANDPVSTEPEPCLPVFDPSGAVCNDPNQRLFWDGLHPTRAAHRIVGNIAFNLIPTNRDEQR